MEQPTDAEDRKIITLARSALARSAGLSGVARSAGLSGVARSAGLSGVARSAGLSGVARSAGPSGGARSAGAAGACLRDTDGRTYAGAAVALPSLQLSAVAVVVAMAVSSGAAGVEAVAVASADEQPLADADLAAVRDLGGTGVPVWLTDPRGGVRAQVST